MSELLTVYKWIWVWDFDKEEEWLNQMAAEGKVLESVGFCTYRFRDSEPGEYTIRLDLARNDSSFDQLLRDSGAEYIGRVFAWTYYRRKTEDGPFELYSDIDSKQAYLDRIARVLLIIFLLNFVMGMLSMNGAARANILCSAVLAYAIGRIHGKKEALDKERRLHE